MIMFTCWLVFNPSISASDFAQRFKANTSRFINSKDWVIGKFEWQSGFGAFSVSQSGLPQVRHYIANQDEHHRSKSFRLEYEDLLSKYQVSYNKEYIFDEPNTIWNAVSTLSKMPCRWHSSRILLNPYLSKMPCRWHSNGIMRQTYLYLKYRADGTLAVSC